MGTQNDEFLQWVTDRMRQLAEEDAHLANTLRGIEERRKALAEQMGELQTAKDIYDGWKGPGSPNGAPPDSARPSEPAQVPPGVEAMHLGNMTVADAAEVVIRAKHGRA